MDQDHHWTEEIEKKKREAEETIEKAKDVFAEARAAALRELGNTESSQNTEEKPDPPAAGR